MIKRTYNVDGILTSDWHMIKRNTELWKPIEGFPDYEISNMGRVKSLDRTIKYINNGIRFVKGKILKPGKDKDGYFYVNLMLKKKPATIKIHSLVIGRFGESKPTPKHECNHIDGVKQNNWNSNLEWLTHAENMNHAKEAGLCPSQKGDLNGNCKLSENKVNQIRKLYSSGEYTYKQLCDKFEISLSVIGNIITFKTWGHL